MSTTAHGRSRAAARKRHPRVPLTNDGLFAFAEERLRRPLTPGERRTDAADARATILTGKHRLAAAIEDEKRRVIEAKVSGLHARLQETREMRAVLVWLHDQGVRHATRELDLIGVEPVRAYAAAPPRIARLAERRLAPLLAGITLRIDAEMGEVGVSGFAQLSRAAMVNRLAVRVPGALDAASRLASTGFIGGLADTFDGVENDVASWIYSAVLDDHTCEICADHDGDEFETLDEAFDVLPDFGPNPECFGGDRCRCRLVPSGPAGATPADLAGPQPAAGFEPPAGAVATAPEDLVHLPAHARQPVATLTVDEARAQRARLRKYLTPLKGHVKAGTRSPHPEKIPAIERRIAELDDRIARGDTTTVVRPPPPPPPLPPPPPPMPLPPPPPVVANPYAKYARRTLMSKRREVQARIDRINRLVDEGTYRRDAADQALLDARQDLAQIEDALRAAPKAVARRTVAGDPVLPDNASEHLRALRATRDELAGTFKKLRKAQSYDYTTEEEHHLMQRVVDAGRRVEQEMARRNRFGDDIDSMTVTQRRTVLREVLSELRQMGREGRTEIKVQKGGSARDAEAAQAVEKAQDFLPRDWLAADSRGGQIRPTNVTVVARGHYGGINRYAAIDRPDLIALSQKYGPVAGDGPYLSVAVHELGHRMEATVAGLSRMEQTFFEARTFDEVSTPLSDLVPHSRYRADERTKRDKFVNAYMGKTYGGTGYYELFTTGIEAMVSGQYGSLRADPEMRQFILGLLALV